MKYTKLMKSQTTLINRRKFSKVLNNSNISKFRQAFTMPATWFIRSVETVTLTKISYTTDSTSVMQCMADGA